MAEPFRPSEYKRAVELPEITLATYLDLPEDVSGQIEVVDGWMVRCESAGPNHQGIQLNALVSLREAVKAADSQKDACHRVRGDVDVLISETPKFHFRRPDVVVYRCIEAARGAWGLRPYASDCVLVVEIVSADSVITDTRDKRAEYAAAGIPHYWIIRMVNNDGPAISVERFFLTMEGSYVSVDLAVRRRDFHAIDTIDPFRMRLTWEQLDENL